MPTILDLLNVETDYYSYGNSYFDKNKGEALTYLEGIYYYFYEDYMMTFSRGEARNLYNFTNNEIELLDSISYYKEDVANAEQRVKAIIQRYNRDLIQNKTTIK